MPSTLSPTLRKAAVLVNSLDAASADRLLEQMPAEFAQRVRNAVLELDDVPPAEQQQVIEEFFRARGEEPPPPAAPAGAWSDVEIAPSLARRFGAQDEPAAGPARPAPSPPPLALHDAPIEALTAFLEKERPQMAAIVAARLPPARAAALLAQLSPAAQAETLDRLAELEEPAPEVVAEVEAALAAAVAEHARRISRETAGRAALSNILAAAGDSERQRLAAALAERRPRWADERFAAPAAAPPPAPVRVEQIPAPAPARRTASVPASPASPPRKASAPASPPAAAPRPSAAPEIAFDDLAAWDDRAWALLLGRADPEVSLVALAGAKGELVNRLLGRLPTRDARRLRRRMEQLGPLRLRDVEHAQQRLAALAGELVQQGLAKPPRRGMHLAA